MGKKRGVCIAEGLIHLIAVKTQGTGGWVEVAAGMLVPLFLGRSAMSRLLGLAGLPIAVLLVYPAYLIIDWVIENVSTIIG